MERSDVEPPTFLPSYRHPTHAVTGPIAACCITGMHRSGTSMIARLLSDCGMFLGPDDDLDQADRDNPEGHFENLSFVKLNEDIITQFGGSWDDPPSFPTGWEFAREISAFIEPAEKLVRQFRRNNWGWKDPRNSLTVPFWRRLIPDLKVLVCVRNPLEVARSLFVRGDSLTPSEFQLWLTYYSQLLSATQPMHRLVTHYQSYFQNAAAELRRVFEWLEFEVRDEAIERASAHVSAELRHHYAVTTELIETKVPDGVLSLYLDLCAEAGPVYQQARKHETTAEAKHSAARANEVRALIDKLQQLRLDYAARERTLNEILNSKSFRLVSWYWGMRRRK